MSADPRTSVAFTGHRSYRGEAGEALSHALESLHARGFRTFLSGMAAGFDLAAAEAVLVLRDRHPDVQLIAVVPFRGQGDTFTARVRQRYEAILAAADQTVCLSDGFHPGCYMVRNDWLVDHAAVLVAWYDGSDGGTRYTVRRALSLGREILSLHPATSRTVSRDPELFD